MLRIYFSGRVDANGLAETVSPTSFLGHRTALGRASTKPVVRSRSETSVEGAPCPPREYDRVLKYEAAEEQSLWDEAQDEALRSAAERFNEHSQDVP